MMDCTISVVAAAQRVAIADSIPAQNTAPIVVTDLGVCTYVCEIVCPYSRIKKKKLSSRYIFIDQNTYSHRIIIPYSQSSL